MPHLNISKLSFVFITIIMVSCQKKEHVEAVVPLVIYENQNNLEARFKEIRDNTPIQLADGLKMGLFASDSLVPDPIALSADNEGSIYFTRTNRQKNSEFDIRGYRQWMTPSISLQTVEDRRQFLRTTFAPEKSAENTFLADLNRDSIHDWHDLTVEKEEVWKIEDTDKNGFADKSTRVFEGFNEEITDVAGALLVRDKDAFIGVGPDMWRLDKNADGMFSNPKSISHGYAVHIGFGGHGMSGLVEGPDGKIYWGIGDIGANLTDLEGNKYDYANEGVIVRCNPDGSDFEVFASGLRNTHEFVFDQYGNLITCDNDGDHPGESERLVHLVQGSDSGWRSNWQYGKYTDPINNTYKVWMDEKLFTPRWDGQAAYILPPIMNFHNGPTGMQFNPGTALGKDWTNKFFIVEFVGNPAKSPIWAFDLKPKGASFELKSEANIMSGILPTGIKFGPDGALYVADWVNGWNTKNFGRLWKIDVSDDKNDLAAERKETQRLMTLDYGIESATTLAKFLEYPDMRIRQKAQFALVSMGAEGLETLKKGLANSNQMAKIHAIWGIGQVAHKQKDAAKSLLPLLNDNDPEIIAQAIKTIGDVKYAEASEQLLPFLGNNNDRVKFFAAEALGRMAYKKAIPALIAMLRANNDTDVYLRHAAVLALARIGAKDEMVALSKEDNIGLRTAAVLVLRRLKSADISVFLNDQSEYIVTETARAINDDHSIPEALPALAGILGQSKFNNEALMRRAINAALRVGDKKSLELLLQYAKRADISDNLREEALATLATWDAPSVLDRVDGRNRGEIKRDKGTVLAVIQPHIKEFLSSKNVKSQIGIANLIAAYNLSDFKGDLVSIFQRKGSPEASIAAMNALAKMEVQDLNVIVKEGIQNDNASVREAAIALVDKINIPTADFFGVVKPIFDKGGIGEKQSLLKVLAKMPSEKTEQVLDAITDLAIANKLDNEVLLELSESIDSSKSEPLKLKFAQIAPKGDGLDAYSAALYGGNKNAGRGYFLYNSQGQCTRCHVINEPNRKSVGPDLDKVGSRLDRKTILEALVNPSARLAPGYGQVILTLDDGHEVMGILSKDDGKSMTLQTSEAEPLVVPNSRIKKKENLPSSMPPMSTMMSKREMRDVVEFLSSLK